MFFFCKIFFLIFGKKNSREILFKSIPNSKLLFSGSKESLNRHSLIIRLIIYPYGTFSYINRLNFNYIKKFNTSYARDN